MDEGQHFQAPSLRFFFRFLPSICFTLLTGPSLSQNMQNIGFINPVQNLFSWLWLGMWMESSSSAAFFPFVELRQLRCSPAQIVPSLLACCEGPLMVSQGVSEHQQGCRHSVCTGLREEAPHHLRAAGGTARSPSMHTTARGTAAAPGSPPGAGSRTGSCLATTAQDGAPPN